MAGALRVNEGCGKRTMPEEVIRVWKTEGDLVGDLLGAGSQVHQIWEAMVDECIEGEFVLSVEDAEGKGVKFPIRLKSETIVRGK